MGLPRPNMMFPRGLYSKALTDVTALATNVSNFVCIGEISERISALSVYCNITTAYIAGTYAEVAVYYGPVGTVGTAPASLTRGGFVDVSAIYNATGRKTATITSLSAIPPESVLWIAFASQAGTQFQIRGLLADDTQSGVFLTFTGRPSTSSPVTTAAIAGATAVPPQFAVGTIS